MAERNESFPAISSSSGGHRIFFRRIPITIEPILFIVFFALSITDGVSTNVLISRTCSVIFHLPPETCNGPSNPDIEGTVQPYTTKITMYKSIVEAIISGLLSLFIGPWSDTNGRKPFLVLPVAGYTLCFIVWYILFNLPTAHPMWFLLPSVFFTLSGGLVSIFTCIFCYITDITNERNRAFRMAVISSSTSVGVVGGYSASYFIAKYYNGLPAPVIFLTAIGSLFVALIYTIFFLPESLSADENQVRSFFNFKSITEMVSSIFMERPKKGRARLLLSILVIGIGILILQGDSTYRYYALRKAFSWSLEHYNIYAAIVCAIAVITSTVGAYISTSVVKVHELYVALFAALMSTLSSVLSALSRTSVEFYFFSVVGCFGTLLNPMLKTQITRNIDTADLGKIFAFISTFEALTPLIASPVYRTVYNDVLEHMPLAVFFVSASFWLLSAVLLTIILIIQAFYSRSYQELIVNGDSDSLSQEIGESSNNEVS